MLHYDRVTETVTKLAFTQTPVLSGEYYQTDWGTVKNKYNTMFKNHNIRLTKKNLYQTTLTTD